MIYASLLQCNLLVVTFCKSWTGPGILCVASSSLAGVSIVLLYASFVLPPSLCKTSFNHSFSKLKFAQRACHALLQLS